MIYKKLKEEIQERGYKMEYIAKVIGVSPTTLGLKIKGTCTFKMTEIYKIIDFLKLNKEEIINIFFEKQS
ncbi:helix-turn-helix transcriptional regulator [uncultured Sneathia sp.]|uniref:helix-turn-helix transcriptional regulator n=1 Tax=uncultured Sneathia sp. TaxID=278067 RepID=UPI00259BCDDC|nr:helix-turn-helix transcriptional regulator [uncultured Sneathia sp.]